MSVILNLTPAQQAAVDRTCVEAIGKRIDVRLDAKNSVQGVIESCKPNHWGKTKLVFRVTLLCGVNKTPREVLISTFNSVR